MAAVAAAHVQPRPSASGLRWRSLTPADIPAWLKLLEAAEAVDHVGELPDAEELLLEFEPDWADPERNALFGFDGDQAVAFAWVQCNPNTTTAYRVQLWGEVHPGWRRVGVGSFALDWLEARGRQLRTELGGELPANLEVSVDQHQTDRARLLERRGFVPTRHWIQMGRDLADTPPASPPLAHGLALQPYRRELDEALRVVHNEAFADHWGFQPRAPDEWRRWYTGHNFRGDLSWMVLDGDQIAGYCLAETFPQDAELKGYSEAWVAVLGTRPAWRRRGIAAALLGEALRTFAAAGFDRAALGVDAENASGALCVYERAGFGVNKRSVTYTKPVEPPVG